MPFKSRTESLELLIYRILNIRSTLTADEKHYYINLEKGYSGELMFDKLTENLGGNRLILNDLLLESNRSKFQLDTVIIYEAPIYLFEVKNYEGDHIYDKENFYTINWKEIKNSLDQLKRSVSLFRQLLRELRINIPVKGYVVFINPAFTLYQAPLDKPIIFSTQLNHFFEKLNRTPSILHSGHVRLADQLASLHQIDSPYNKLRHYKSDEFKKGFTCALCHSFFVSVEDQSIVCNKCGTREKIDSAVMRCVKEIKLLFPNMIITTTLVHDWCRVIECKKRIRRILLRNLSSSGYGKWSFYE